MTAVLLAVMGIASFMDPSYGADYLALPEGPGHTVTICGPAACVTRVSTDAGPDKAMQRKGRVADLSFHDFKIVCGCDPWQKGLVKVTVEYGGTQATIPPTDSLAVPRRVRLSCVSWPT